MTNILKIGITGGIGSGKSIVSKVFKTLGIPTYNSDDRAKWLMNHDEKLIFQLKDYFGSDIYDSKGSLITTKLGAQVFSDKTKLAHLNSMVHPRVAEDFEEWNCKQTSPYILKEAAIIFEHQIQKSLDAVILVVSPIELRIKNIQKRDPYRTSADIVKIIDKQMPDEEKIPLADYILYNNEKDLLIPQIVDIHHKIINR